MSSHIVNVILYCLICLSFLNIILMCFNCSRLYIFISKITRIPCRFCFQKYCITFIFDKKKCENENDRAFRRSFPIVSKTPIATSLSGGGGWWWFGRWRRSGSQGRLYNFRGPKTSKKIRAH